MRPQQDFIRSMFIFVLCLGAVIGYGQKMKFLSYNIRLDVASDSLDRWDRRKEDMVHFLHKTKADVVGLQEVLKHQLDYILQHCPQYAYAGVGRADGKEAGEYSPILYDSTRFELVNQETFWLSETPEVPGSKGWDAACERIATTAYLKEKGNDKIYAVLNTHWDHISRKAREESAKLVIAHYQKIKSDVDYFILMGDLNCNPETTPIQILENTLVNACSGDDLNQITFNGFSLPDEGYKGQNFMEYVHIDYFFVAADSKTKIDYQQLFPRTFKGRQLSDHYPITLLVEWPVKSK